MVRKRELDWRRLDKGQLYLDISIRVYKTGGLRYTWLKEYGVIQKSQGKEGSKKDQGTLKYQGFICEELSLIYEAKIQAGRRRTKREFTACSNRYVSQGIAGGREKKSS